jgi:hypothetical protein
MAKHRNFCPFTKQLSEGVCQGSLFLPFGKETAVTSLSLGSNCSFTLKSKHREPFEIGNECSDAKRQAETTLEEYSHILTS